MLDLISRQTGLILCWRNEAVFFQQECFELQGYLLPNAVV